MAYNKKTWLARLGQGLNKFIFNGGSKVTLDSSPDVVTQVGTPLSAENMNDLEQRIADEFANVNSAVTSLNTTVENIVSVHEQTLTNGKAREYKFSSGLLIINICITGLSLTPTQAAQGLYLFTVSSSHIDYTFNTPFVDVPTVSAFGHSNGNTWYSYTNSNNTKTKMSYAEFFAIVSSAVLVGFSMTLTGRWK